MKANETFFETVSKIEKEFCQFHGNYINQCPNVFKVLCSIIKSKYSELDDFVIMTLVRTQTFIRMEALNKQKNKKTKKLTDNEERKKMKKNCGVILDKITLFLSSFLDKKDSIHFIISIKNNLLFF